MYAEDLIVKIEGPGGHDDRVRVAQMDTIADVSFETRRCR